MRLTRLCIYSVGFLLLFAAVSAAQTKKVTVRFAGGEHEATMKGRITGYGVIDFVFSAKGGQQLTATLVSSTDNKASLTVMKDGERVADDASEVPDWSGSLSSDGSYVIRVGMMRAFARRMKTPVSFTLKIRIT